MSALVWQKSFEVGEPTMDEQHQRLIALINDLDEGVASGSNEVIGKAALGLLDYARVHFAYEEGQMEARGYPEMAAHRKLHTDFMKTAMDSYRQLLRGDTSVVPTLVAYLQNWLLTHIMADDRALAAALMAAPPR